MIELIKSTNDIEEAQLFQWDLNRQVKIRTTEAITTVHFARSGDVEALVVEAKKQDDGCYIANIPNIHLQEAKNITAYVVKNNVTIERRTFQVKKREKPSDYTYIETSVLTYEELKKRIDETVEDGLKDINDAKAEGLSGIQTKTEESLSAIGTKATGSLSDIEKARKDSVDSVNQTGKAQVKNVQDAGSEATTNIANAKKDAVDSIGNAKAEALQSVEKAKTEAEAEIGGLIDTKASAIVSSTTSEVPTTTDAAPVPPLNIIPYGKSEQRAYEGYQLFDASQLPSKSNGGCDLINNGDGTFTILGSGELTVTFNSSYVSYDLPAMLKTGTLYFNDTIETFPYFHIYGEDSSGTRLFTVYYGNSVDITQDILDNLYKVTFSVYGQAGAEIVAGTMKPMLYQDGDGTWEPFVGNAPSPSMAYPQPIVSAGQRYLTGAQLFDKQLLLDRGGVEQADGSIYIPQKNFCFYTNDGNYNGQYSLTATVKKDNADTNPFIFVAHYTDGTINYFASKQTYTTEFKTVTSMTDKSKVVKELWVTAENVGYFYIKDIMVNKGNPIPYEPYTGGVAKVIDVGIEAELLGRNSWDEIWEVGKYDGVGNKVDEAGRIRSANKIRVLPNTDYFSVGNTAWVQEYDSYGRYIRQLNTQCPCVFTTGANTHYITFYAIETYGGTYNYDIAIIQGTSGVYEPYKEPQTLSIPYVLRGLPINDISDRSQYITANYIDSTGKEYVGDYIDFKRNKLVRRIGVLESPTFHLHNGYTVEDSELFSVDVPESCEPVDWAGTSRLFCNVLLETSVGNYYRTGCYQAFKCIFARIKGVSDVDEFNDLMKDSVFYYILETPIETDLTDEDIQAYNALCMNKGYNTLVNDAGCLTEVEYVCDTKLYVDNKFKELEANITSAVAQLL